MGGVRDPMRPTLPVSCALLSTPALDPAANEPEQHTRDDNGACESHEGESQTLQIGHGLSLPESWNRMQNCDPRRPLCRMPGRALPRDALALVGESARPKLN